MLFIGNCCDQNTCSNIRRAKDYRSFESNLLHKLQGPVSVLVSFLVFNCLSEARGSFSVFLYYRRFSLSLGVYESSLWCSVRVRVGQGLSLSSEELLWQKTCKQGCQSVLCT